LPRPSAIWWTSSTPRPSASSWSSITSPPTPRRRCTRPSRPPRPSASPIAWKSTTPPSTAVGSTWPNQAHISTAALPSGDNRLGYIMVLHPGHPLVGQVLTVVRRYGQRAERQWVIELPDGSRQYVPAAWCTPLAAAQENSSVSANPPHGRPSSARDGSPLSLPALRDLAALVRRLQAAGQQREEQRRDGTAAENRGASERAHRAERADAAAKPAEVGEFPASGSPAPGVHDSPRGTPTGREQAGDPSSSTGAVSER